jgi:hypothetical protein
MRQNQFPNSPVPIPAFVLASITVLVVDMFVPEPTDRLDSPLALVLAAFINR